MLMSTLQAIACPKRKSGKACLGSIRLEGTVPSPTSEIKVGTLLCSQCGARFPILEGVPILVNEVREYLLSHVKGISKFVPDDQIPKAFRAEYSALRAEWKLEQEEEHIEEDLESDRVNALYLMNHYLKVKGSKRPWWKASASSESPLHSELIERYWDQGPMEVVGSWVPKSKQVIELGCGVGGLARKLESKVDFFLGVDSSFQSILLARHFNLGIELAGEIKYPSDLLFGNHSQLLQVDPASGSKNRVDFIVGEIDSVPAKEGFFDGAISLNAIDMLDQPKVLPETQFKLLNSGGFAIQTGPYIWHEKISKMLRAQAPKSVVDSSSAVEWLYEKAGFSIEKNEKHIPWLFFKHLRQLELYSVHAFMGRKS